MSNIKNITALEVLDSRGNPTVMATIELKTGEKEAAIVPSGASTGSKEALELRDGDKTRYLGKGVLTAVTNVNNIIAPELIGKDSRDQKEIDQIMLDLDGTENKANLGANAILAVSMANTRVAAKAKKQELFEHIADLFGNKAYKLPVPMMNIINGGEHANNKLDIQEFMINPVGFKKFSNALRCGSEIFHNLKKILNEKNMITAVGDEGGFAPDLNSTEEAINTIIQAIEQAGYSSSKQVNICLDCAASEYYENEIYNMKGEGKKFTSQQHTKFIINLCNKYPITSIEDINAEQDWQGWQEATNSLGSKIQLVGDDVFVTNPTILQQGIKQKIANSILIKLNQIGTVTETLDCIKLAMDNSYSTVISHRSGETRDTFIADLAVGTNAGQIKTGSLSRSERVAKYNRLLEIEFLLNQINN